MRIIKAVLIGTIAISAVSVLGRDLDGRWAQSPNKEWFDGLKSRIGSRCCSDADGQRIDDPDWKLTEKGYVVRIKPGGPWHAVPDTAVVSELNKVGYAVVWPVIWPTGNVEIRCFMPGSSS